MKSKFSVRKIKDLEYPWGIFEGDEIIGRAPDHETALKILKGFEK